MNNVIELNAVTKSYQRGSETIRAVNDLTLSVAPGEFVAIVGPSGSGKTTLLNLIGCVDKPDGGTLRIDGEETSGLKEAGLTKIRARKIGFVFQQFFLLPTLTALENVQLPAVFQRNGDCAKRGSIAGARRSEPAHPPSTQGTFRRRNAARGHRPRSHQRAKDSAGRRTDRKPRFTERRSHPENLPRVERKRADGSYRDTQRRTGTAGGACCQPARRAARLSRFTFSRKARCLSR